MLFVGCYGDHEDSIITCYQENAVVIDKFVVIEVRRSNMYWVCEASWIDTETDEIHAHGITNEYQGEYRGCKELRKLLTADISVEVEQTEAGPVDKSVVSNVRCL